MGRWIVIALALAACSRSDRSPESTPATGSAHAHHEDRHEVATAPPTLKLAVTIAGSTTTWSEDQFGKVTKIAGTASDGEARETWSLRELAHQLVGPTARVVSVTNAEGTSTIDAAAWNDPARTPILHTTKRGALKFRWADKDGKWGETVAKDVTGLEIAR